MSEIPLSQKDLGIATEQLPPREDERESLKRTLATAWVATVNKIADVVEGVRSYVFSRDTLTEQEQQKASKYTEDEFTPEELVFILRSESSRRRREGFVDRIKDYQTRLGIEEDESQSVAVAQDMQRAYMYLSEHGAKKLGQVYERNSKDDNAIMVKYKGELQGVSLDAIGDVLAYNKDVQIETLLEYGFNPDTTINADALREQIAEAKFQMALEDKKTVIKSMQRTFGKAMARIGGLAAMSGVMATLLQTDAPLVKSADALRLEDQRARNTLVLPNAMPSLTPIPETAVPTTITTITPSETPPPQITETATSTPTPTEAPTATVEVAPKSYYRFGNIELGPADGTPGKPTFLFIESTQGNFVLFFRPKQLRVEDLENNGYDWRLPYNIAQVDGDPAKGEGATLQTIHSGHSNPLIGEQLNWPAESIRTYIEEQNVPPEQQIAQLKASITKITVVQADGFTNQTDIDYANPEQVQALIADVNTLGKNMINPIVQEAELITIDRLNPSETTSLEDDYASAGAKGQRVSLTHHLHDSPNLTIGDLTLMFCGEAVNDESKDGTRPANQQTRTFIALRTK